MDISLQIKNFCKKLDRMHYASIGFEGVYGVFGVRHDTSGGKYSIEKENIKHFFDHEHLIKKTACFWKVASILFALSANDKRWVDAFHRNNRHRFPFADRLKATTTFYPKGVPRFVEGKDLFDGYIEPDDLTAYEKHFAKIKDDDEITIYRSFKVRKGEAVRKGVKKLDNPEAHIQEEGSGISYTMNRTIAIAWSYNEFNPFFLRKYGDLHSKEEQREFIEYLTGDHMEDWERNNMLTEDAYSCLGTYSVKKKDIYFITIGHMEEVVVNTEVVKLERYDFLSWAESMALGRIRGHFISLYRNSMETRIPMDTTFNFLNPNLHLYEDVATKYYSLFYDYPDAIKKLWLTRDGDMTELFEEMVDKQRELCMDVIEQVERDEEDTIDWDDVKRKVHTLCGGGKSV
mgnify:FL=1|jgi:hypothetical protein